MNTNNEEDKPIRERCISSPVNEPKHNTFEVSANKITDVIEPILAKPEEVVDAVLKKKINVGMKEPSKDLPVVILKKNPLKLADVTIPCAIVSSNNSEEVRRVLTSTGITNAILGSRSGASIRLRREAVQEGRAPLPIFLAPGQLKSFVDKYLCDEPLLSPIEYIDGGKIVSGYDARILPIVCEIWLKAREAGVLQKQQLDKAQKAEILIRALAHIGIISLVDEATGYQDIRPRDALAKLIEEFVAKEMRPYVAKFPPEFYKEIFRLRGLDFPTGTVKKPQYFGHLTMDVIYKRLAPAVWMELKERAKTEKKVKKPHLHRYLSDDVGDPRLQKVLTQVITVMQLSKDWKDFKTKLDRIIPVYNTTLSLPLDMDYENNDDGEGL